MPSESTKLSSIFSFRGSGASWTRRKKCQPASSIRSAVAMFAASMKLFDDLVADRVDGAVRADHTAVAVEIDLHFLHRQLERAQLEASASKNHRQLVHVAEQLMHLGREFRPPRFAVG